MNVITRGLFFATLVFSPMVLSSDLMNYCLESSEVLNCDMMCSQNENFVPVFPKPNGDCPKNPSPKWLDFNNPITLDQICELETEMIETTDAYGRALGPQVNMNLLSTVKNFKRRYPKQKRFKKISWF